ncbi:MAG: rhomboid family intrarane serine protease [Fibrobacteres bacterium]|nr:rhomboid family intrarane serine protease [Fibrobacterota bacterium]
MSANPSVLSEGPVITYAIIALNVAVSMWAFSALKKGGGGFRRFVFSPFEAAHGRNLSGIFLSQFSHADFWHLFFNMMTLFIFGRVVEAALGIHMLTVYAASGLAATALVFILRRNNPDYRVLGASGSVTGILFAAIVLNPEMSVYFLVIPVPIPAPIFAVLYIAYSSFLLDRQVGNVAHEAHIGGALTGFLLAGLLYPYHFGPILERAHRLLP